MILWAIDPGVTTGNTVLDVLQSEEKSVWYHHGDICPGWAPQMERQPFLALVEQQLAVPRIIHFQVETFTITAATARKGQQPEPIYVIGTLLYLANKYGATIDFSLPSQVMKLFPDFVLKRLGLFTRGQPHANDAARHAALYLLQHGLIDYKDMHGDSSAS